MWCDPLLKFNPIKILCNLSNWIVLTLQYNFYKLLNTIVKISWASDWIFLYQFRFMIPVHLLKFLITVVLAVMFNFFLVFKWRTCPVIVYIWRLLLFSVVIFRLPYIWCRLSSMYYFYVFCNVVWHLYENCFFPNNLFQVVKIVNV